MQYVEVGGCELHDCHLVDYDYRFEQYPVTIKKTIKEDEWEARVPRQFGTKQQAKPTGGASSKGSPKSSSQR